MLGPQSPEARLWHPERSVVWSRRSKDVLSGTQALAVPEPFILHPWDGRGQGPFISDRPGYLFAANSREEVVSQAAGVELQLGRGPGRGQDGLERAARTPCAGPPAAPCLSFPMWRMGTVIAPTLQAVLRIQDVK